MAAADLKQREGGTLGEALVRLGFIEEERLITVFQQGLLVPRIAGAVLQKVSRVVQGLVPAHLAVAFRVMPVELDSEGNLTLAMADPADNRAVDEIVSLTQRFVMRAVAAPSAIRDALATHYRSAAAAAGLCSAQPDPTPVASALAAAAPASNKPASGGPAGRVPTGRVTGSHGTVSGSRPRRQSLPPTAQLVPEAALPGEKGLGSLLALTRAVEPVTPVADTTSGKAAKRPRSGRVTGSQAALPADGGSTDKAARPSGGRRRSGIMDLAKMAGGQTLARAASGAAASGSAPLDPSLLAPVSRLQEAQTRDEVVAVLLDYASLLAARVGLFVVQQGQLTCLDGRGPDHVVVAMKWFTIPVDTPSPFRDVLESRKAYMGSLEDSAESRAFRNALGSSPGELLLLPLLVGERVVGVLYADELKADLNRLSRELETLSLEAGAAFARIILSRKRRP